MADSASNGSPPAESINWNSVLDEHQGWLRTVIRARLGEPQAVDDVYQELALAAVKSQAPVRDRARLAPWLYQLAVRQSLMHRRKQGRRKKLVNRYTEQFQPTERDHRLPDPLTWLMTRERDEQIRQAIDRIPRRYAEVLMLKYAEGWSYVQMAGTNGNYPERRRSSFASRKKEITRGARKTKYCGTQTMKLHETISDELLDRLVDNELPHEQRQRILGEMERHPNQWRRCALAFLEAQAWTSVMSDDSSSRSRCQGKSEGNSG